MEPITLAFWISFPITLVLLVAALVTGLSRRRKAHLWLGPGSLLSLAVAVVLAVLMGRARHFPPEAMGVHRIFATTAGVLAILVAITGVALLATPRARAVHKVTVFVFFVAALAASGTGIWVFSLSTPR